ncbi:hypothetical protein SBA3_1090007 [Candidatus Sulfopaludibacter sp. SbA3]|nr:hypothetical protein SBA3_1090007 [Candidatus Sulfopaludibacter sp. SbA3]
MRPDENSLAGWDRRSLFVVCQLGADRPAKLHEKPAVGNAGDLVADRRAKRAAHNPGPVRAAHNPGPRSLFFDPVFFRLCAGGMKMGTGARGRVCELVANSSQARRFAKKP